LSPASGPAPAGESGGSSDPVDQSAAPRPPGSALRVVGIASSAGGLEALREVFEALPESDRLSYVVAQHVSPTHVSTLAELLAPRTKLRVVTLEHGDLPQPGTIAIIPPNQDAVFTDGRFQLVKPQNAIGPKPSANNLFQSLAEALGESAVGIVLSGTGSDGAAGLRDIQAAGGVAIVQDPASAEYDGMPRAALRTARVDLVLRPEAIGPALERLVCQPADAQAAAALDGDRYGQILQLVRQRTAFRLDGYKPATVRRRIARRLALLNLSSLADYVDHLRTTPDEAQRLVREISISVTAFFRDRDAWHALEQAIATLVRHAPSGVLRCWVPGCATGEEAYSIAMLLEEALRTGQRADLQYLVFASDLDDDALEVARQASYPVHALEALPPALRDRHVELHGDVGRVAKGLRNRLVFARQNVIDDPPFSRLDLISCRNLLIYLNPPVQRRVLELFRYALKPDGRLFLGRSEALDVHADLFAAVDLPARLYQPTQGLPQRSPAWRSPAAQPGLASPGGLPLAGAQADAPPAEATARRLQAQLVARHVPPSVLIDHDGDVLRFEGKLHPFLGFPTGAAGLRLFDLVEPGIQAELRALVIRCRRDRQPVQGAVHACSIDGRPHAVRLHLEPLEGDTGGRLIVSFIADALRPAASPVADPGEAPVVAELQRELAETREHLVVVVDELQSANEQMQSANEALQSANEELQSTNEELRTVNEELQSTNEELLTVNEELQAKTAELEASASMLTNVKQSLDFPLLVVDSQRRVLDANRFCVQLVRDGTALNGVPLQALAWRFPVGVLENEVQRVLDDGERLVRELPGDDGQCFRLHLMPYRTGHQGIGGAMLLFEDVTALRGAEDRYRQVTESLPLLVWTCTPEGTCDYLSPQWVAYTGVPEAPQLGFGWLEQLHPDDRQRTIDRWTATAGQGLDLEIEFRIRRHDGTYRWFHTLARPLRDTRGAIVKWYGSNTDIDDRKRAEAALQVAADSLEQRVLVRTAELEKTSAELARAVHELEDLYHNAPCGYHSIDDQGRLLRINDTELRWLGYSRDELIGRPISELMTPEGQAVFAANHPRLRSGEPVSNLEVEWRRKDGSVLPMLVSATPVVDDEGRYLHSRSVLLDHRLLRAQQRTLRSILANAPMAVRIARQRDHRVVFCNQAFADLVQCGVEQALGADVRGFYADPAVFDRIAQRIDAGETVRNELVEVCRLGQPDDRRWTLASYMPIDHEGEPAVLGWKFDVTELQQARRHAEEASRSKSRFLANMSHEIRTPMNGVIGMIEHARRDLADPVPAARLDKALLSARQLLAILNDILDLSKIEAGHARLNPTSTNLAACLEGVRVLYDEASREKGLELVVELDPVLAGRPVVIDALRMNQVLDNLVANAIKFSTVGEVRLRAAVELGDDDGVTVRFEVIDQGVGIATEDQARVFELFEQVEARPGHLTRGTGLGLAICREIVALLGGEIGVHSQVGVGSTFWVRLHLAWAGTATAAAPELDRDARRALLAHHAGARVLIAEDNAVNQEVLRMSLEDLHFEVEIACDGQQAVEAAARQAYALIFMDMQMPVLDGLQATRSLRRAGLNRATPVIAMTANAFDDDRAACLAAGMDDFLSKPLEPDDLERKCLAWLERAAS